MLIRVVDRALHSHSFMHIEEVLSHVRGVMIEFLHHLIHRSHLETPIKRL
jgi:hypothetical protein